MVEKNMKRFLVLGILGLFLVSMMTGVLGTKDIEKAGEELATQAGKFGEGVGAFFTGLFKDTILGKDTLGRIFMALLIGMFVHSALKIFFRDNDQKWILNLVTIAIAGLAILGLPENFLESILLEYGAMGATILTIVPFLVIFWFTIKTKNVMMARGIWLFYTVYYLISFIFGSFTKEGVELKIIMLNLIMITLGAIMFFLILKVQNLISKEELVSDVAQAKKRMEENVAAKDIAEETWRMQAGINQKT